MGCSPWGHNELDTTEDWATAAWTVALQAPLPMEFPRQNTGVGGHFLLQGIFLTQGLTARGIDGAGEIFVRYYFPMAIYSLVLTPLWYVIIRGVSTKFANTYTEY